MNLDAFPLYPYKFKPIPKIKPWGGELLYKLFQRHTKLAGKVGESWEISDRQDDQSIVSNGPLAGTSLHELITHYQDKLMGQSQCVQGRFPLLLKLIDAQDDLSLQVHPPDDYAFTNENESGKTEMWYILHAEPQAIIYCGLKHNISIDQFHRALLNNDPIACLQTYQVKTGDAYYLPAGTVHALGKGIVVAEIQENSDQTYRLYDWGRTDKDGNTRPLHVEKGLQVIRQEHNQNYRLKEGNDPILPSKLLVRCKHFSVFENIIQSPQTYIVEHNSFEILTIIQGHGILEHEHQSLDINKGDFILIPAHLNNFLISPQAPLQVLRTII
ncbi:MAG: mannose-6-phosphate isomerase [Chlamydiota bacterium]|nr:mannose-6-phosphate isomerase [Chlamydiota bacterium]